MNTAPGLFATLLDLGSAATEYSSRLSSTQELLAQVVRLGFAVALTFQRAAEDGAEGLEAYVHDEGRLIDACARARREVYDGVR